MWRKFICALVIAGAAAVAPLQAQDDPPTESHPYKLCIAEIENAPLEAYQPCKQPQPQELLAFHVPIVPMSAKAPVAASMLLPKMTLSPRRLAIRRRFYCRR